MIFLWQDMLWLLLAVPALIAAYVWLLRRKKKAALQYASLSLVKDALSAGQRFRRHVPPLLFLLALTAILVAVARPAAMIALPSSKQTIILAMDVSGSMRATDVAPTRLEAAQAAAKSFVNDVPNNTRIGVVSFGGSAAVVQAPTDSREDVLAAINRFQFQRGTAIGSGIVVSLATIFPDAGIDASTMMYGNPAARGAPLDWGRDPPREPPEAVAPGSFASAAVILLTDGQTTTGPSPIEAARLAANRGVRVYTVGMGTPGGDTIHFEGWSMRVGLDEGTLKAIAEITHGEYFKAGSAAELRKVYETLVARLVVEKKETEITALFSAAGAVLALLSAFLSLLWFNRLL